MCCPNQSVRQRRPSAFTLIELLVVIGIIVLLVSITIPMVMRSFRAGDRARSAADIQTISIALEAFKGDFLDYPRPDVANEGFALLGRDLIGPFGTGAVTTTDPPSFASGTTYNTGDCVRDGSNAQYVCVTDGTTTAPAGAGVVPWVQVSGAPIAPATTGFANDGVDGPGMKQNGRGKTLGPYLQPDKFKVRGLAIIDRSGAPILYFVRSPGAKNTHMAVAGAPSYAGVGTGSAYNTSDNEVFFRVGSEITGDPTPTNAQPNNATKAIQILMGDINANGYIDGNETEVTQPYILWAAGPDGVFGPYRASGADPSTPGVWTTSMLQKYDDVTNFR
jgi:prepilin-type N-terminal cleavage/methylation domain-containing protein